MPADICSVIMAAGASSRMPPEMRPKACCKVGPVSVIENTLRTFEHAGVTRHLVVVGHQAERVMTEVSARRKDVLFAFQPEPKGTGDAVRCALTLLGAAEPPEHVLICAGDKVIAPHVLRGLIETCAVRNEDLSLVAGSSAHHPSAGRIILREDRPVAILETADIRVRQMTGVLRGLTPGQCPRTVGDLQSFAARYAKPKHIAAQAPALGALLDRPAGELLDWATVQRAVEGLPTVFETAGGTVSADEALASPLCNLSVYLGRFALLAEAVEKLRSENAQGEWYFTDAVGILASAGRTTGVFRVQAPEEVMDFNTPEELEAIRRVHAQRPAHEWTYPTVEKWRNYFTARRETGVMADAVRMLEEKIGPERPCIVVRSPGRINLMGRHIDHQGGTCNLMAINREVVLAASPRTDDRINLWNVEDRQYPQRTFTIGELASDMVWEDWLRTLNTQYIQRVVAGNAGDWVNYVQGVTLRLRHRFPERPLRGLDAVVTGNIPPGAGLSSSSALVVAMGDALVELNALNVDVQEFVDLCGEGEWFVGTRGGSADHAAIKLGRRDEVANVSFFPFEVRAHHPFPAGCCLVVCFSGITARKTMNAKGVFNARVACYHMARELIKARFPEFAERIAHLRDVNTERLDVSLPALYSILKEVPNAISTAEIERLAERHPTVAKCVGGLTLSEHVFPLRDVALFGLAECERARAAGALLRAGDAAGIGRMMSLSHDGDRVTRWTPEREAFSATADAARMEELIARAREARPLSASGAALWQQPGAYACSLAEIDRMVDCALRVPGVFGAQLAGAGLGGCMMVLARVEAAEAVRGALEREYYTPMEIPPCTFVCQPARGSHVLTSLAIET